MYTDDYPRSMDRSIDRWHVTYTYPTTAINQSILCQHAQMDMRMRARWHMVGSIMHAQAGTGRGQTDRETPHRHVRKLAQTQWHALDRAQEHDARCACTPDRRSTIGGRRGRSIDTEAASAGWCTHARMHTEAASAGPVVHTRAIDRSRSSYRTCT